MPNKKITVVGDGAEEPLSPEEEHQIEVRVDRMLDPALPDGTSPQPVAPPTPAPAPTPVPAAAPTAPEPQPEPKKVTKIVTKFADDEDDDDEPAAPAPAAEPLPEPEPKVEAPKSKPVVKKIAIKHDDDDEPDEPKQKATKATTNKAKKSKKPEPKEPEEPAKDNLETKADAITAAALAAAAALEVEHKEPAVAEEAAEPDVAPEPLAEEVSESDETQNPKPSTEDEEPASAEDTQGAPPIIQKHSVSPIGAVVVDDETPDDEPLPPPATKKISIVDKSGEEPETEVADEQSAEADDAAEAEEPAEEAEATEPETAVEPPETETETEPESEPEAPAEAETPEPVAAAAAAAVAAEEAKKYRPPEGPIQFKRAEVPIEPLKPGTPRPAEGAGDTLSDEDAALTQAFEIKEPKKARKPLKLSFGNGLKTLSLVIALIIVAALVAMAAVPTLRNKALGLAGVTADMRVTVRDTSNNTPLWNAIVAVGGARGTTGSDGTVTLHGVKLGDQQLAAKAWVYAGKSQPVTIAWHSQSTTNVALTTTGTHYKFIVVDYVSGQPVANAKVSAGPAQTISDTKGSATLVAQPDTTTLEAVASGYTRTKTALSTGTTTVTLVPTGQDVYISRSGGKFNVYRNSVTGKDEQQVLAGAGSTAADMAIAPNNSGDISALVSTRDNTHDASGNLQDSLSLITTSSGSVNVADHADTIKLVDWFGSRIVYVLSKTTTSTTDTDRYQLVSYNTTSKKRTVLDHAAYLNDVLSAKGVVYYATAANGSSAGQFVAINPDGTGKKVILPSEIAAITRTSYTQLALASVSKWYNYRLGDAHATPTSSASTTTGRQYVDSPNGALSVYVDTTASTPKLVLYNVKTGKESLLAQAAGITYPVHWLGNGTIIYRVSHSSVVTDNVITPSGGSGKTIANVSDIAGISLWHE